MWDYNEGHLLADFSGHVGILRSLDVLSTRMAVASTDGSAYLWSCPRKLLLGRIEPDYSLGGLEEGAPMMDNKRGHQGAVLACRFSSTMALLITASVDHTCKIWDVSAFRREPEEIVHESESAGDKETYINIARAARTHVASTQEPLRNTYQASALFTLCHEAPCLDASFDTMNPTTYAITVAADCVCRIWSVVSGALLFQINTPAPISRIAFHHRPSPTLIAVCQNRLISFSLIPSPVSAGKGKREKKPKPSTQEADLSLEDALPSVARERERLMSKGLTSSGLRRVIAHGSLAPSFLTAVVAKSVGVDELQITRALEKSGVSPTVVLRALANAKQFSPQAVLRAIADEDVGQAVLRSLLVGVSVDCVMDSHGRQFEDKAVEFSPVKGEDLFGRIQLPLGDLDDCFFYSVALTSESSQEKPKESFSAVYKNALFRRLKRRGAKEMQNSMSIDSPRVYPQYATYRKEKYRRLSFGSNSGSRGLGAPIDSPSLDIIGDKADLQEREASGATPDVILPPVEDFSRRQRTKRTAVGAFTMFDLANRLKYLEPVSVAKMEDPGGSTGVAAQDSARASDAENGMLQQSSPRLTTPPHSHPHPHPPPAAQCASDTDSPKARAMRAIRNQRQWWDGGQVPSEDCQRERGRFEEWEGEKRDECLAKVFSDAVVRTARVMNHKQISIAGGWTNSLARGDQKIDQSDPRQIVRSSHPSARAHYHLPHVRSPRVAAIRRADRIKQIREEARKAPIRGPEYDILAKMLGSPVRQKNLLGRKQTDKKRSPVSARVPDKPVGPVGESPRTRKLSQANKAVTPPNEIPLEGHDADPLMHHSEAIGESQTGPTLATSQPQQNSVESTTSRNVGFCAADRISDGSTRVANAVSGQLQQQEHGSSNASLTGGSTHQTATSGSPMSGGGESMGEAHRCAPGGEVAG
eukprot:Rmarinus@m.10223